MTNIDAIVNDEVLARLAGLNQTDTPDNRMNILAMLMNEKFGEESGLEEFAAISRSIVRLYIDADNAQSVPA